MVNSGVYADPEHLAHAPVGADGTERRQQFQLKVRICTFIQKLFNNL